MSEKTVAEKIEDALDTAQSLSIGGMSQSSRSIQDMIAADKHLARAAAAAARPARMGFRMGVFRAPEHD